MHGAVRDEDFVMLPSCGEGVRQAQHDHMVIGRNEIGVQHMIRVFAEEAGRIRLDSERHLMSTSDARTEFATRGGGTGVTIKSRRTDFIDPDLRAADQAQLRRRVSAHVLAGSTDLYWRWSPSTPRPSSTVTGGRPSGSSSSAARPS